jgi:hypothetical protein
MPNSRMNKRSSAANSARLQVVAHKSTGGMLNSIPQPVDPVGNASDRLTNNTVALPRLNVGEGTPHFRAGGVGRSPGMVSVSQ